MLDYISNCWGHGSVEEAPPLIKRLETETTPLARMKARVHRLPSLSEEVGRLDKKGLKELLEGVAKDSVTQNRPDFIHSLLKMLTPAQMLSAVEIAEDQFQQAIELLSECQQKLSATSRQQHASLCESAKRQINKLLFTIVSSLRKFAPGRESSSPYEASLHLDTYFKILAIPFILLAALSAIFMPVAAGAITASVIMLVVGGIFAYIKCVKPFPEKIYDFEHLTLPIERGEIKRTQGRSNEINQAYSYLQSKCHFVVVGRPGEGKTQLLQELARQAIEEPDLCPGLKQKKFLMGRVPNLLTDHDAFLPGGVSRFKAMLEEIATHAKDTVVILDELQEARKSPNLYGKILECADKLRAREGCLLIGITTPEGYATLLADHGNAFATRFIQMPLQSMNDEDSIAALRASAMQTAPEIQIPDEVMKAFLERSKKEFPEDKQIRFYIELLSSALSFVKSKQHLSAERRVYTQVAHDYEKALAKFEEADPKQEAEAVQAFLVNSQEAERKEKVSLKNQYSTSLSNLRDSQKKRDDFMRMVNRSLKIKEENRELAQTIMTRENLGLETLDLRKQLIFSRYILNPVLQNEIPNQRTNVVGESSPEACGYAMTDKDIDHVMQWKKGVLESLKVKKPDAK